MRNLERLLDVLPDAVAFYDDERRYIQVNAAACALFGRTRAEMRGVRMDDVVVPSAPLVPRWQEFVSQGVLEGTTSVQQLNGRLVEVVYRAQANVVPGIHVTVMRENGLPELGDATLLGQLVALQQETLATDVRLDTIMRSICARAMLLTGAEGATIELREGDDMVYRATAGSLATFDGFRVKIAGSLSGMAVLGGEAQLCVDTETDPRVDREACRRTGARSMIVVPLEHSRRLVGVLKVSSSHPGTFAADDLERMRLVAGFLAGAMVAAEATELRRELALREADRLRELERLRDEMTSLVVHDLKSPLTVIMANIEYLRNELPEANADALEAALDALAATRRLDALIRSLLDTARLEQKQLRLSRTRVELQPFVEEIIGEREHSTKARGLTIIHTVADDLVIDADRALFRRVVDNIVDNALRYVPDRGRVVFRAERVGGRTQIRIANTGPALPVEMRERIFEKFAQLEARALGNFGLGLYFCRLAVEAHGGRIWVESTPELPAVFALEL